jgi:serine/threonine-protein kinase RsbW
MSKILISENNPQLKSEIEKALSRDREPLHISIESSKSLCDDLRSCKEILENFLTTRLLSPVNSDPAEEAEFNVPSNLCFKDCISNYIFERAVKSNLVRDESNLRIALDEAFVNAVKHGNRHDESKRVKISMRIGSEEGTFRFEDEGEGFNVSDLPDPCDEKNLLKDCGRGLLLISQIMDKVTYNKRGNILTMIKYRES